MAIEKRRVTVKPGSRTGPSVEPAVDGTLVVHVRERAVDGAANAGVIAALADYWGVHKRDVRITAGKTARIKTVTVDRAD